MGSQLFLHLNSKLKKMEKIRASILYLGCCFMIISCAQSTSGFQIDLVKGEKIDVVNYQGKDILEKSLKKKMKGDEDFQVEKALIPRGGNLYIKETKYQSTIPLLYVLVVGREGEYRCEDPEIKAFISKSGGLTYDSFSKTFNSQIGFTMKYSKSEFDCNIEKTISTPFMVKIIDFRGDTAAIYTVKKLNN